MANTGQKAGLVALGALILSGVTVGLFHLANVDLGKCAPVTLACETLTDTGYEFKTFAGKDCREQDAGFVLNEAKPMTLVHGSCMPTTETPGKTLSHACACHGIGDCDIVTDGGTMPAPMGRPLGPNHTPFQNWVGDGCVPMPCIALAGHPAWPKECPRKGRH